MLLLFVQMLLAVVVPSQLTLATGAQQGNKNIFFRRTQQKQKRQQRSPDDVIVGTLTRNDIERMFRLERGSLITFRDGEEFDAIAANNRWTPYTGIAVEKTRTEVFNGPPFPNGKQILYYNPDGKSYVSIFLDGTQIGPDGNPTEEQGGTIRILGYSGPGIRLVCAGPGREIVPYPIPPEDFETYCYKRGGLSFTEFNDASCSYIDDSDAEIFAYNGEGVKDPCGALSPEIISSTENLFNMTFGCNGELNGAIDNFRDGLEFFAFKNVNVFTDVREDGEEWDPFIVENRDALFKRDELAPKCTDGKVPCAAEGGDGIDDPSFEFVYVNDKGVRKTIKDGCEHAAKKKKKRCGKKTGIDGEKVRDRCPVACGQCS